ncbi:MAG TPA: DUF305 domain-containing protein [Gemmatimonadota bacterium]|nr:DUF305 domain-containing protein [Gemmatimonadota bacterium]
MRSRHTCWRLALAAWVTIAWSVPVLAQGEPSTAELEAIYKARTDSARMRFNEADVRFMTDMIHHHAQALVMAGFAPTHGASPTIQTLAARIVNAQEDEIATMKRWLEDRGQPVPEAHLELPNLTIYIPEHDSTRAAGHAPGVAHEAAHVVQQMPGMLTPAQMAELDRARGPEFDRLFLTYMIQHHQGAVTMVDELFATDGAAQDPLTFKLASDVQVDQRTEIDRMEKMLSTGSLQRKRS